MSLIDGEIYYRYGTVAKIFYQAYSTSFRYLCNVCSCTKSEKYTITSDEDESSLTNTESYLTTDHSLEHN